MPYDFPPDLRRMMEKRMASDLYASEDDLLLDALYALHQLHERHQELKDEIQVRIVSAERGLAAPLDFEAFKAELRATRRAKE